MAKKQYIGAFGCRLPAGYTQVEYLQSSGTQYIDTGYKAKNTSRFMAKFQYIATTNWNCLFGSSDTDPGDTNEFGFWYGADNWFLCYGSHATTITTIDVNAQHEMDWDQTVLNVDGETKQTFNANTFSSAYATTIFAFSYAGRIAGYTSARLWAFQIYEEGTLVRDFVPAVNSDGIAGLYDLKNRSFYTNAGTGAFTTGSAVQVEAVEAARLVKGAYFGVEAFSAQSVARRITRAYIGDENGIARMFLGCLDIASMVISYTGAYTDQLDVVMSGKTYRLLTLTGSGTLTLEGDVTADVWMCSGGNGGAGSGSYGGGGGFIQQTNGVSVEKTTVCTVGAGAIGVNFSEARKGNVSTFGDIASPEQTTTANNGASGGGQGGATGSYGSGTGESTIPFGESGLFDQHSAGGGGGGCYDREGGSTYRRQGGDGGSNGSDGLRRKTTTSSGGSGGEKGGGGGGTGSGAGNGRDATFYGSGGGGGGYAVSTSGNETIGGGGAGYQGVIYVRIPYEQ